MRHLLLTFSFLLFNFVNYGQAYYPPIENYSTTDYSTEEIRLNPENFAIVQDSRGVMYFGNSNGVLEYDGKNWIFIGVKLGSYVKSLSIDSNDVIYVGSNNDLGLLKPDKMGKILFHSLMSKIPEVNHFFGNIEYCYTNDKKVFFQSEKVLFIYDIESEKMETILTENSFHTSFMSNGNFYVRERNVGLKIWLNNDLVKIKGTDFFKNEGCFGLFNQSANPEDLLLITNSLGVYSLKGNEFQMIPNSIDNLKGFKVFGALRLSDGNIALRTFDKGVFVINENSEILYKINRSTGLRSSDVKDLFEDRDQNLWLGLGNGISKINYYSPLSFYNEKSGIDGNVQSFIRFNDLLYVGTSFGLFVQNNNNEIHNEFIQTKSINDQVWDLDIVNNQLYIASTSGMYLKKTNAQIEKINSINTTGIYYDEENKSIISAGNSGVYIWDLMGNLKWSEEMPLGNVIGIEKDKLKKEIWIGTLGTGAIRLVIRGEKVDVDNFLVGDGLIDDLIVKPIAFKNELLFGLTSGIFTFFHEDEMKVDLAEFLTEEELNDPKFVRGLFEGTAFYDSIFDNEVLLIEDDKDYTWYVANHKLGYYVKDLNKFINKPFWGINYGRINNLYLEENGVLWIGCADGLIRFKKNEKKNYQSNFTSLIRRVIVSKDTIFNGRFINEKQIKIPDIEFSKNRLNFIFSSPYFEDEHKPKYSFILEGYDKEWSDWGDNSFKEYTSLNEGTYTFKVKARNIYYQISDIAEYTFTISPPWYRTPLAYLAYVFGLLILVFIASKLSSMRLKSKNEQLEKQVEERTVEISAKNEALEFKNEEISEQKREIEDSINYAKRIQDAILPLETVMKKNLPNSFVIYKPKDIVSGDFYWFTKNKNKLVIVCADCTGHGVPGAFMSMIGSDRLNIIVNERNVTDPGKILSELNRAIKKSLKQKGEEEESTRDGMDAAICTVDLDTNKLVYAGAHRPLWIIQNNNFKEIKATKVAIAGFTKDEQVFKEHSIDIEQGMKFYMTTDGYADQFGGINGKKYMVKRMKKYILSISDKPYDEQQKMLENEVFSWMNDHAEPQSQVDDICLMGFEF